MQFLSYSYCYRDIKDILDHKERPGDKMRYEKIKVCINNYCTSIHRLNVKLLLLFKA